MFINKLGITMTKNHTIFVILPLVVNRSCKIKKIVNDLPSNDAKIRYIQWNSSFSNKYVKKKLIINYKFIVAVIRFGVIIKTVFAKIQIILITRIRKITGRVKQVFMYLYVPVLKLCVYCFVFIYALAHVYFTPMPAYCVPPPSRSNTVTVTIPGDERRAERLRNTLTLASPVRTQVRRERERIETAADFVTRMVHTYPFIPFFYDQNRIVPQFIFFRPIRYRAHEFDVSRQIINTDQQMQLLGRNVQILQNTNPANIQPHEIPNNNQIPDWLLPNNNNYVTDNNLHPIRLTDILPSDRINQNEHLNSVILLGVVYDISNSNMRNLLLNQPLGGNRCLELLNANQRRLLYTQIQFNQNNPANMRRVRTGTNQRGLLRRVINFIPNQVENIGNFLATAIARNINVIFVVSGIVVHGSLVIHYFMHHIPLVIQLNRLERAFLTMETNVNGLIEAERNRAINQLMGNSEVERGPASLSNNTPSSNNSPSSNNPSS